MGDWKLIAPISRVIGRSYSYYTLHSACWVVAHTFSHNRKLNAGCLNEKEILQFLIGGLKVEIGYRGDLFLGGVRLAGHHHLGRGRQRK